MRIAIILVVLFTVVQSLAQDSSPVTVKNTVVNNGVVIVTAQSGKESFELQCNKDVTLCTILKPGDYTMVRLPKNRGMYDCANAEVYRSSADPNATEKIGAYCLIEQK
jgi:hypothetical protein